MRGYLSFFLVFAAFLILVYSAQVISAANNINLSKAIALSKFFDLELNVKQSIIESVRSNSVEGMNLYTLKIAAECSSAIAIPAEAEQCVKDSLDKGKAEDFIRKWAHAKLLILNSHKFADDTEIKIWCSQNPGIYFEDAKLRKKMIEINKALTCDGCKELNLLNCIQVINPELSFYNENKMPEIKNVKMTTKDNTGFFGISMFSKKYNISGVSYIPATYQIKP